MSDNQLSENVLDLAVLWPASSVHPLPPTAVTATYSVDPRNANTKAINLAWVAPANSPDLMLYQIWRNDVKIAEVLSSETTYRDESPSADADYASYFIVSMDIFESVSDPSEIITNLSLRANTLVDQLRRTLKDSPPDPRVRRWTDCELLLYLDMALSDINATPLRTNFSLDTLPVRPQAPDLSNLLLVGARIAAHDSQAGLEVSKEFNMGAGGITMSIDRSQKYIALSSAERAAYEKQRDKIKLNFLMSTVAGEGVLNSSLPFKIRTYAPRQYRVR